MAPRLNKRQQREQQELEALAGPPSELVASSEDEQVTTVIRVGSGAGFSALFTPEEILDSTDEESSRPIKSRKSKKKKKKAVEAQPPATASVETPSRSPRPPPQAAPSKKATKKAKAREKKADKDELDKTLADLAVKYPDLKKILTSTPNVSSPSQHLLSSLLSVSLAHLDSEAEMRKFFGSKVVQANKPSVSGPSGPSSRRQPGTQRSSLTRPQPSWWAAKQREGLSIRALTEEEVDDKLVRCTWNPGEEKWWTVEYSKKYKSMTMAFMRTVMSGDPEGFWDLLGKLPWHADTLLQLSEVYRHREEHAQAVDFVDRALFTYERSFVGAFTFTSGVNRLDFDHVENRPFFLAIHRQITDLQRRGCVRTSFEFSRLLYSLDPGTDPHGSLFHLDYLAIKSGMNQWLLDVYDHFAARREREKQEGIVPDLRIDPSVLPGWAYARALALRMVEDAKKDEDHKASTNALKEAINSFPTVVALLADKLDLTLPANIRSHRDFKIETEAGSLQPHTATLHLLSHLYVQRSFSLWKDPDRSQWFTSTVASEFSSLPYHLPATERRTNFYALFAHITTRYSVYRHVMVLESSYRRLFSFIPKDILNVKSLACDPLPPVTSVTEYDEDFFRGTDDLFAIRSRTRHERIADERRLERLIPDPLFREQLQAFLEAHPNFRDRFPGGIVQFAEMIGQLPPEAIEDIMIAGAQELEDRGMPGQMPGQPMVFADFTDEEDEGDDAGNGPPPPGRIIQPVQEVVHEGTEEEDDDDDDEEPIAPMPVRLLRNFLGRFWPGNAAPEDSSDDEIKVEAPAQIDNSDVD